MIIDLDAHGYRLSVAPEHGATILSADWKRFDGEWLPLLEPLLRPQNALNAGCFVMAPFANRINGGSFPFAGQRVSFPVNRPISNMSCHGFARETDWQVLSQRDDAVLVYCEPKASDYPWRFSIAMKLSLSPNGIAIDLEMKNIGPSSLPFGFGLHPWFPKPEGARLSFRSAGTYGQDLLGLPINQLKPGHDFYPASSKPLESLPVIDSCFVGWDPTEALVEWPSRQMALEVRAEGALKHLHVYLPETRPVFCAEPVSHVPDVVNRPDLGEDVAMTVLSPQEILKGRMSLRAFRA